MPKKKTSSKTCLACGARLLRADAKYAKQYCDEHKKMMDQLRQMRQPCRMVGCRNPSHEDGYCDTHRPFHEGTVYMREDWLKGEGLIQSNTPTCPYYSGKRRNDGESYRCKEASETIKKIYDFLNN